MDKDAKYLIKRFTPAYNSAKELIASEDEDKLIGAMHRLSKKAEEGDPDTILEIVLINVLAEIKGK